MEDETQQEWMKGTRLVPHSRHKRNQTTQPNSSSDLPHPTAQRPFHLLQNSRRLWIVHPTSSDIKENDQQSPNPIISILGTVLQRFHVLHYPLAHVIFDEIRNTSVSLSTADRPTHPNHNRPSRLAPTILPNTTAKACPRLQADADDPRVSNALSGN
jgi:hypothetical protein